MKAFLITAFLLAVVVAFAGALTQQPLLYRIGAVLAVLLMLAAYGINQLNTYLQGEKK